MNATADLFDQVRAKAGISSDNVLSQRMGVTRAVVSNWRSGVKPIPDERIAQLCALGKLDGPEWMARIHAEKAQSPAERALWSKMLVRLAAAAIFVAPLSAGAADKALQNQAVTLDKLPGMYIMLKQVCHLAYRAANFIPSGSSAW